MNKDVLIVILIAIIVTLTYFLFHPSVVTQRKTAKIVPQEQEINISADKLPVNQNEADTVKSPISPNFRIPDDTGYNNCCHSDEISTGSHPASIPEKCACNQPDNRHLRATRHKCRRHNGHLSVPVTLNRAGSHYARNPAAAANQHRYK